MARAKKIWLKRVLGVLFYCLIGLVASLLLLIIFYWGLRLDSTIYTFVQNFGAKPFYFWPYVGLTGLTIFLFGLAGSLLIYRLRKYGRPKLLNQTGLGLGAFLGLLASSCAICGSTLLAGLGLAGGLAVFPLAGLELKALSALLMGVSVWLLWRDLRWANRDACEGHCPPPADASFRKQDFFLLLLLLIVVTDLLLVGLKMLRADPVFPFLLSRTRLSSAAGKVDVRYQEAVRQVLPSSGFESKIALGDSITKLIEAGVVDVKKFEALYGHRGGLPQEIKEAFEGRVSSPIHLTAENANYYLNLLWPLGLANFMNTNKKSPVAGKSLFNFASTGGWTLGKKENGGEYFNKFKIVTLTKDQEDRVTRIAQNTYRPCCNNSTFFQDCNHGSALLGLLELGASQELSESELYRQALAFNSFWFPDTYIQTALYFKLVKGQEWKDVDPKMVLGRDYSSASGWAQNVQTEILKIPNLLPQHPGGSGCGV